MVDPTALRLVFAGTPEFAAVPLQALLDSGHQVVAVYTQPDRPAGRGRQPKASPVKELALAHGLPVYQPVSLKDPTAQAELAALKPDLMIVVAYGLLLPQVVLDIPRLGCINIHASLLPRWRGAAPIQRAIEAGDEETGVTIMQMEAGLDTGPMLHVVKTPITAADTGGTLHDRLARLGAEALLESLPGIAAQTIAAEAQDDSQSNYARKLDKSEAEVDWTRPAIELEHLVRAFNPWPVAQTTLADKTLRLWRAAAIDGQGPPGTILRADKGGIVVACGAGALRLEEVQAAGGKPVSAADFLNGHGQLCQPGTILGTHP